MVSLGPLRHPGFRRLAASYTLNELGWGFGIVALGLVVFDNTHSALAMTALWICTLLIPALIGPAATAQLDRLGVRRVLPALYLAEAVIFAALALLTSSPLLVLVLVLAAADGTLALVGRALTRAAVAATLKPLGQLDTGNTLLNVSFSLCFAIGPAVGGLVIAAWGVSAALWVSAGLFAAMSVTLVTSRALPPAHADAGDTWLTRVRAGISHALSNVAVRRIFFAHAIALVCAAMISPIEVIWAKDVIGGGNSAYGIVLSAWGLGTLVTGLMLVGLWRRLAVVTRIPLAAGTMGIGYVVMAVASSVPIGALGCFIGGLGNGFYFVSLIQAIQERTADEYQGRVMGLLESTTAAGYGVGFLLAGAITELFSVRATFAATAVGVILATILMATLLRRTPVAAGESRSSATGLAAEPS
jgi:predicted MFS family arabinose efflux permease